MRDYWLYRYYAARRMLPWQRLETHLAQISLLIARTMGGADKATLRDFLFEPEVIENRVETIRKAIGFMPRKKKVD